MKKILRKIVFVCAVLFMGSVIFVTATSIFVMKTFYSNDYLLDILGLMPKASYQTTVNQR
jgi:hypothetical protein